jgi:hypothetical protein
MSLRTYFASKIPALYRVETVTDAQLATNTNQGVLHRFLVCCDVAWGVWGGPEPCTTISSRCAFTLLQARRSGSVEHFAAFWALALGAFLESIDPGHLQGAMIADVSRQVGGALYLTGTRVLQPPKVGS